jgi:hypothetical protein
MSSARTVTELIAQIQKWFPEPNTLVYLPAGIVSKESFEETAINSFDELPADWSMPDSLFQELCNQIDNDEPIHDNLWESISDIGTSVVTDWLHDTAKETELWEG